MHYDQQHGIKKHKKEYFCLPNIYCLHKITSSDIFLTIFFLVHLSPESSDPVAKQLRCLGLSPGGWDKKRSINVAGLSLSICYCGTNFYFFTVIYHNKFCRSLYVVLLLNKSITKTWGYVWYNRKCNHKKKKPRIEIIWLLTILLCCLRQLHISIELFYDQASMLLKYYLFSLSHSDKKWQALRTVIHMENKIWSCGENSVGVRNSSWSIFLLKLPHHSRVGF